jgi:TetR/AcrR family transcriptional regulator
MARAQGGPDTRERMLQVAETQFARKGYEGAHLESIASEVGVRKTALYYYFDSKEALYVAVLERILREVERTLSTVLESDLPIVEKGKRLADDINDLLGERPNYSLILIRIFVDRIPIDNSTIAPIIERVVGTVLRFYQQGVKEGRFRKLSSRHFFLSVLGMAIFHYAGGEFSAVVLGVDDIFAPEVVAWRRSQYRQLLLRGVLGGEERD